MEERMAMLARRAIQERPVERLAWAAFEGNLTEVKRTVKEFAGVDVNANSCFFSQSALLTACKKGHTEVALFLLTLPNVDINNPDPASRTPLMFAGRTGCVAVVRELLSRPNIDVNRQDCDGETALHKAVSSVECVQLLLRHPATNVTIRNCDGGTVLHAAVEEMCPESVRVLAMHPVLKLTSMRAYDDATPLHRACQSLHRVFASDDEFHNAVREIVEILFSHPLIGVNMQDLRGETALHKFVLSKSGAQNTQLLLNHPDIDVNLCDWTKWGHAPLHSAVQDGNLEMVQALLSHPTVNVNIEDKNGQTPLHMDEVNVEMAQLLVNHPSIDLYATDFAGQNVLDHSVRHNPRIWRVIALQQSIQLSEVLDEVVEGIASSETQRRAYPTSKLTAPFPHKENSVSLECCNCIGDALAIVSLWLEEVHQSRKRKKYNQ